MTEEEKKLLKQQYKDSEAEKKDDAKKTDHDDEYYRKLVADGKKRYKKRRKIALVVGILFLIALPFIIRSCNDMLGDPLVVEGIEYYFGEEEYRLRAPVLTGKNGVWELPNGYRVECKGVYLDTKDEAKYGSLSVPIDYKDKIGVKRDDLEGGESVFRSESYFVVVLEFTNLGYTPIEEDLKAGDIENAEVFEHAFDIVGDKLIFLRSYPFQEGAYEHDNSAHCDLTYNFPLLDVGESSGNVYWEFVGNRKLDIDKNKFIFSVSMNPTHEFGAWEFGVFDMDFQPLSEMPVE